MYIVQYSQHKCSVSSKSFPSVYYLFIELLNTRKHTRKYLSLLSLKHLTQLLLLYSTSKIGRNIDFYRPPQYVKYVGGTLIASQSQGKPYYAASKNVPSCS